MEHPRGEIIFFENGKLLSSTEIFGGVDTSPRCSMKIFWYVIPLVFQVSGEICEAPGGWVRDKEITRFTSPQL